MGIIRVPTWMREHNRMRTRQREGNSQVFLPPTHTLLRRGFGKRGGREEGRGGDILFSIILF